MKLHFHQGREIVFFDKPSGLSTHAPDTGKQGLAEIAEAALGKKLWVVHRLDKTTTGAIAFATSAARTEELRGHFENHEVKKTYWFLSKSRSEELEYEVESRIEKKGSGFVSLAAEAPNAKTKFKRIKRSPFYELWEATPLSGKPHQVRLHAADAKLPILGDELYGGARFPHLCLHALSLHIPGEPAWTCPAPRFFERLGVLKDPELVEILASLDRRQRLYNFLAVPAQCLRLIHSEMPFYRLDKLGGVLWLNWYRSHPPAEKDLERWDFIKTLLRSPIVIQKRQDRGQDPNTQSLWHLGEAPDKWTAQEGDSVFEFRKQQGLSAGLFLDQRRNREEVQKTAAGKKVLNLFAYTAGFSLAAAQGGATEVTTVDLSKSFLEWSKENFRQNKLDPEKYEWNAADSFLYLSGAKKRVRTWDLIICDPPSFSRGEKKVFKLKDDLETLLMACQDVLAENGTLLFSCNLESIEEEELQERIHSVFRNAQIQTGPQDLDFELPNEERSLKSFWIINTR